LTYSIIGGADQGLFSINSSTGALTFNTAPNFEAPTDAGANNVYDVTVQVSDGNGGTDIQAIAVTVTDANDAPVITSGGGGTIASVNVAENTTAVTTVTATDADLPAQSLTYSIIGGADQGLFSINSSTGALTLNTAPNFEAPTDAGANNVYDVTVQVSDGNGGTDTQAIAVTVTNVNEPPVVNDQAFSVPENAANGTPVGTVVASDVDAGDTRTFSIAAGNTAGAFTINTATGQITVANAGALDFETNPTFILTVQVQDAGGLNDTATVTVTLTNVNDAPVITSNGGGASASVSIAENTTAVTTVSATDADLPAQTLSYAINGGADAALFTIDNATGVLSFNAAPDFEAPADANADNVYKVTVQASDGSLTDTQALSVTVISVNDAPSGTDTTVTTNEDTTYRFAAVDFGFTDVDAGDALSAVRIDTLPAAGSLTLSGAAVSAGQVVSVANLTAGNLLFTPAANANGSPYASFSFSVRDTSGPTFDPTPNTMTVNMAAVNDAPVNTVPGAQTVAEDTPLVLGGISVNDADGNLSTVALAVGNGTLTVTLQGSASISAGANGSAALTLSGSQADINATLATLSYQGSLDYNGADTLTVTSTDTNSASDTEAIPITVIAAAPAGPAPPSTGGGIPEGSPSAPGSGPSSEVDDGSSSKTSPVRKTTASDGSPVTVAQPVAVSRVGFRSKQDFSNDTSQNLGSKQPVAKGTNAAAASAADVQDAKDPYSTLKANRFLEELNRLRDNMNHKVSLETLALSLGLSVGYAIWLVRGGALLSSLLSSLPAWRWLDPLPVLAHLRDSRDDEEGNEDSLQAVLKNAEARDQSKPIPDVDAVPPAQQAATDAALSQPDATASLQEKAEVSV
ncbi:MAG: cadherin domain-containing protein, partial [Gammaproteobacteria bacterium]